MKFFVIGEDKSLKDVTDVVLALAGGAMTGNISYQGTNRTGEIITFLDNTTDQWGNGVAIGDGGVAILGGGESAHYLAAEYAPNPGTEKAIVSSDSTIEFYTNCQNGVASATHVTLSTAGLLSGHQKAIKYGTAAPSGGSNGDIYIQY